MMTAGESAVLDQLRALLPQLLDTKDITREGAIRIFRIINKEHF
jgi:hypothetical protein